MLDAAGRLDPARRPALGLLVIDHDGGHMDRRQPQDIHVPLYNNGIGPGAARVVHYRVRVPEDARGSIDALGRRPLPEVHAATTRPSRSAPSHPSLPVTTLASDTVALPVAGAPAPPAGRPGLRDATSAGQPRPALAALERLRHRPLPAGRPEGRGARLDARRRARAGQAGRAAEPRARRDRRGPPRGRQAIARRGREPPAGLGQDRVLPRRPSPRTRGGSTTPRRTFETVLAKFPLDRVAWNNLGSVYWLAGRFPEAIEAYGKTLAIDPEDLNAHYNLMRVYRAIGDRQQAAVHDAAYRKYKEDETGPRGGGRLPPARTRGPTASRSRSTSTRRRSLRPRSRRRGSRRSGPKGYETDIGYLTRTHPPIIREARDTPP